MIYRFLLLYLAVVAAFGTVLGTGLITDTGNWYSSSLPYRLQTDALLDGRLALSESPHVMAVDLVWAEGGVQQVWGLGVPVWRLPFEAAARLSGQPAFPDRIVFAVALAIVGYFMLRVFLSSDPKGTTLRRWSEYVSERPDRAVVAALFLFFPPLITLYRGPFHVYEEAVAYGCLAGFGLFAGLIALRRNPTGSCYFILCLGAGLIGFFRPTMLAYGLAAVLLAVYFCRTTGWRWRRLAPGILLFTAGIGLLLATNAVRFGAMTEFGHRLNLTSSDLIYSSRLASPFDGVSVWEAGKELFGATFLVRELNGFSVYDEGAVPFQASVQRWRHFYHTTFDPTFLALLLVGLGSAVWAWVRGYWKSAATRVEESSSGTTERTGPMSETGMAAAWSLLGLVPMAAFYLHFHAISSRYLLDFAPGIAAGMAAGIFGIREMLASKALWGRQAKVCFVAVFAVWWGGQVYAGKHHFPPSAVLSRDQVMSSLEYRDMLGEPIPDRYDLEGQLPAVTGIPRNGLGWNSRTGATETSVALFVRTPHELILEVEPDREEPLSEHAYSTIRAKVGLEELTLASMEETGSGRRLVFNGPVDSRYRDGVQVLVLGFVAPEEFLKQPSPFRLVSVETRRKDSDE